MLLSAGFTWFGWLSESITHDVIHVYHGLVVFVALASFALLYKLKLKPVAQELIPDEKISLKNIFQLATEGLLNLMRGLIPHHTEDYLPLIGSVFIFIFVCNIMGVIPGLLPPTESLNTNYAVAFTVFFYYHYVGFKRVGFKNYMEHFIGPDLGSSIGMILFRILFFAPLMFVIEVVGHCIRPVSLSLRLFGNIYGDHQVLSVFSDLTQGTLLFFVPVVFLGFGIFVSFVQAFVFTLLSSVYIGLAVETHDH